MNRVLFSHKYNGWETPQSLFDSLNERFHFTVDGAATKFNSKAPRFFEDGLLANWDNERVFCNPPYSAITLWVEKGASSRGLSVFLIPSRTDTKWFHKYIYKNPRVEIEFIKGRLKFGGAHNSAPFPSMVVVFNPMGEMKGYTS